MANKPVILLTFANDKVDDALYLRNLPKELHGIRNALQQAVKVGLCEVVERTAATVDQIFDIFQDPYYKDRIAIFHYGGHASGDLLMLETLEGGHGHSHSEGLVPFFGKQKSLQLVFFNGCSSQQQAEELIEEGVPAVVGTSTAIDDEIATNLSVRFYNGIATGQSIDQAWQQAIDEVKTKKGAKAGIGGDSGHRGLRLRRDKVEEFPWNMFVRKGSEIVKDWNLPTAVDNPLFGLPELPKKNLPETPYRFLQRYTNEQAEIFFGRSYYIRDLYKRTVDDNAAPVILFYGQSGVGKSSMLDSGVLPRLEQERSVKYIRRNPNIGLLGTLKEALGIQVEDRTQRFEGEDDISDEIAQYDAKLKQLQSFAQDQSLDAETTKDLARFLDRLRAKKQNLLATNTPEIVVTQSDEYELLARWKEIEAASGEPYIILLDQVEETFTRPNEDLKNELEELLEAIQKIFTNQNNRPQGKLIMSYRKEYHPEINEGCKNYQIPREEIFLKRFARKDIIEIVKGLSSTDRLQRKYNLTIEPGLAEIIADDLLEDKDSPVAPVLQILLTKMWNTVQENYDREFTIDNYQQLRKDGILMDDFFHQQMAKLKAWNIDLVESGLALDILYFHTTKLGTAGSKKLEEIRKQYEHRQDILDSLISKFKDLYLLTDAGTKATGLAHDTIAPLVQEQLRKSDLSGQRALRILEGKTIAYEANPKMLIDVDDLELVEQGKNGMRLWKLKEEELIEKSRKRRDRLAFIKKMLKIAALIVTIIIIGLTIWALYERGVAKEKEAEAVAEKNNAVLAQEAEKVAKNKALESARAARAAEAAEAEAAEAAKTAEAAAIKAKNAALEAKEAEEEARKDAEEKRKAEEKAKKEAIEAQKKEEVAKKDAEEKRKAAEKAEAEAKKQTKIAENGRKKAFALALAGKSTALSSKDHPTIKARIAKQAFNRYINANEVENKDDQNVVDPYIYTALYEGLKAIKGEQFNVLKKHTGRVKGISFKNANMIYTTGTDGKLFQWNIKTWNPVGKPNFIATSMEAVEFNEKNDPIFKSLSISPNGKHLVIGGQGKNASIKIGKLDNGKKGVSDTKIIKAKGELKRGITYLKFIDDHNFIVATKGDDAKILSFTLKGEFKALGKWNGRNSPITVNRTKKIVAWATDNTVTFYNNNNLINLPKLKNKVTSLAFNQTGSLLAIGLNSGNVEIYEVNKQKFKTAELLHGVGMPVTSLAFDNNKRDDKVKLATGNENGKVKIWLIRNIQKGDYEPLELKDHSSNSGGILSLAFTPNRKRLLVGTGIGEIKVWDLQLEKMANEICKMIGDNDFTAEEWNKYVKDGKAEEGKPLPQKTCN